MLYIFTILCTQISFIECTIDIRLEDYAYLADHLTTDECYFLFTALHFMSQELPPQFKVTVKKVPPNIPCIKLLLKWDHGEEKWEGVSKTHMDVAQRLRQIGRRDLADWLGRTTFQNLAKDMNNTLVNSSYFEQNKKIERGSPVTDKGYKNYADEWTAIDSMLWVLLVGLLGTVLVAFCRILHITYKKAVVSHKDGEEMIDLLSVASVESDVEETIYEFRNDKGEHSHKSDSEECNAAMS